MATLALKRKHTDDQPSQRKRPERLCRLTDVKLDYSVPILEAFAEQKRRQQMLLAMGKDTLDDARATLDDSRATLDDDRATFRDDHDNQEAFVSLSGAMKRKRGITKKQADLKVMTEVFHQTKPDNFIKKNKKHSGKKRAVPKKSVPLAAGEADKLRLNIMFTQPAVCPYDKSKMPYEVIEWQEKRIASLEEDVSSLSSLINKPELEPVQLKQEPREYYTKDIIEPDDDVDTENEEETDDEDDLEHILPDINIRPQDDPDISEYEYDSDLFNDDEEISDKEIQDWNDITPEDMKNVTKAAVGAFIPLGAKRKQINSEMTNSLKKIDDMFAASKMKGAFEDERDQGNK